MLTRWLVIGLLVSVAALLLMAGAVVRYVRRQRHLLSTESDHPDAQESAHPALDKAIDLREQPDPASTPAK